MSKNTILKKQKAIERIKKEKAKELTACISCGEIKERTNFYKSYNEKTSQDGMIHYCKSCLKAMCCNKFGEFDEDRAINVLKIINRPYIPSMWLEAMESGSEFILGTYIGRLNRSKRYRAQTWSDGDLATDEGTEERQTIVDNFKTKSTREVEKEKEKEKIESITEPDNEEEIESSNDLDDFEVTKEMLELFGTGYSKEEYFHMWNKYTFLRENYTEQTNMHTEALITYIRYKVKEEIAIAKGKPNDAKTWGELAMKQADKAKINPYQFSKADLQGGLSTIGEIAQAVEQNVDIIPVLPKFKYRPNDAVDFCIWNYINYARELEGKPIVEYKDVYKFYDTMKEEYISNTGDPYHIFDNDPTEENRDKVETFIQLPEEYYEEGND